MFRIFFLRFIQPPFLLLKGFLFALIVLFFLSFLNQWNHRSLKSIPIQYLQHVEHKVWKPIDRSIHLFIPPFSGIDLTNLIKISIAYILLSYTHRVSLRVKLQIKKVAQQEKLKKWRKTIKIRKYPSLYVELERKIDQINRTKNNKQQQVLNQEIAEIKKKLARNLRYFSFLSMDVVDSTGMKKCEDKPIIQLDFLRFKRMIQKIYDANACVKSTWTPDGAMACFNSPEQAIIAAKESIIQLKSFNEEVKQISRDFIIRCGIHAGYISYDDKLSLQEISDQVIDIAGHLQKNAEPGTISISKLSIKPTVNTSGFLSKGQIVDEHEVYQWSLQ